MLDRLYFFFVQRQLLRLRLRGFHASRLSFIDRHSRVSEHNRLYGSCLIIDSILGAHTYATNTRVANATIGKFCSIGPETLIGGLGRHPTHWLSTHPVFYSSRNQSGISFSRGNFYDELPRVSIGNDVWIGARAIVLDGVTVGDGAIIAAGAIVTKDVAPYSIVGGTPARHLRFRVAEHLVKRLQEMRWWDWSDSLLSMVCDRFRTTPDDGAIDALSLVEQSWYQELAECSPRSKNAEPI